MGTVTIIVELVNNRELRISGPLDSERELCVEMLAKATEVARTHGGGGLVIPSASRFVDLSEQRANNMIRKEI
jgi:hypothetical protein